MKKKIFYAVLKLSTDVEVVNPLTGQKQDMKLGGIAGYIPVFDSMKEANKSAEKGKYEIIVIRSS